MTTYSIGVAEETVVRGAGFARVLVLMASYNGAAWIEEQVRSILCQEGVDVTLAVRDDSSVDGTVDILKSIRASHRIDLVRSTRPSGSAAKNFFALLETADVSRYDFVALADQDDIWKPDKLRRAVAFLSATGAAGYSGAVRAFWPDGSSAVLRQDRRQRAADFLFEGAGQGCSFVLTLELFAHVQGALKRHASELKRTHYHDWAIYALCRMAGKDWVFDPQVCLNYRQHKLNDTGARRSWSAVARRLALIRSGWYGDQIESMARFCLSVGGMTCPSPAATYLQLSASARHSVQGRLSLCCFILKNGRRRTSDRLILAIAALSGYLSRAPTRY